MADFVRNSTSNVSTGGGVKGGYFFSAPIGTPLPTTPWDQLDPAFVNLGFISEDGITNTQEESSDALNDMNGDAMATTGGAKTETIALTLAEAKADVFREIYGHSNVTDDDGVLTAHSNSTPRSHRAYVARVVLKDDRRALFVIEDGQVTAIGDLTINSTTLFGREMTITCFSGEQTSDTSFWLIESTETKRPAHLEGMAKGTVLGRDVRSFGTFEVYSDSIVGVANKIEGFTAFAQDPEKQSGFYMALKAVPATGSKVTGPSGETKPVDESGEIVVYLGADSPDEAESIAIEGADGRKFTYTLDITAAEA